MAAIYYAGEARRLKQKMNLLFEQNDADIKSGIAALDKNAKERRELLKLQINQPQSAKMFESGINYMYEAHLVALSGLLSSMETVSQHPIFRSNLNYFVSQAHSNMKLARENQLDVVAELKKLETLNRIEAEETLKKLPTVGVP